MNQIVLYDGWSLVYQPNHPSAIHLRSLLQYHPPDFGSLVVLPANPQHSLPYSTDRQVVATPATGFGRIRWEQLTLPKVARERQAGLIHLFSGGTALFAKTTSLMSPCAYSNVHSRTSARAKMRTFSNRLRYALGEGGASRLIAVLLPGDLPDVEIGVERIYLPPVVLAPHQQETPSAFRDSWSPPESFILYQGPHAYTDLRRLLDVWSWAAGPIGDYYPLVIPGCGEQCLEILHELLGGEPLPDTIRTFPHLETNELLWLYQQCTALLHPAETPAWGNPIRIALAYGKPVVGLEDPVTAAIVGQAAYLVPRKQSSQDENRSLGAALISVIVEQKLAENLSRLAHQRAAKWTGDAFRHQLSSVYQRFM